MLIAALAGPTFVDWNRFRGEFEAQGQRLTGREVKIGGDISFVVLPAPHLTLNDVSLANVEGGENADFIRIGQIDAEVAFAPLFSGEISATSVKITRPQVHLEVDADGRANWRNLLMTSPMHEDGLFGLSSVSLQKANFEEGTITFADHRAGRNWRVEHVNGDVMATSLVGPIRAELSLQTNNIPFALRIALGNFANKKAFPITAEVQSLKAPAKLLFSGISTGFSSDARVDGTASLELGSTKTAEGEKARPPLRIEAGVVSNGDSATFRNLIVAMAGTTLKGDGRAAWRGRPTATVHLAGEALTLDPLVDRVGDLAAGGKVPFGGIANLPVPGWIDVAADVKVAGLLLRDVLIKDAVLDVAVNNGALAIKRARGDIAGGTNFELSGALLPGAVPRFDGKIAASSSNLAALSMWLETLRAEPVAQDAKKTKPAATPPSKETNRPFSVSSRIGLTPERLELIDLAAAYAKTPDAADLQGNLSFTPQGDRTLLTGSLAAKTFSLDPLRALLPPDAKPLAFLNTYDLDIAATADRLTVDGNTVSGLDMSAAMTKGNLDLRRFNTADFAGAKLAFAGTLSGVSEGKIEALQGKLKGEVTAAKSDGLLKFLGIDAPGLAGASQLAVDFTSGQAVDSEAKLDTLAVKGTLDESRVDAVLKRGRDADGNINRIDLIANAVNANGRALLRQLNFKAGDALTGAGIASLQMSGASAKPYDTTLRVNVGESTFTAKGATSEPLGARVFTGHADIAASNVEAVMVALGAPGYATDFAVAQAGGPSFVFSSDVKSQTGMIAFNNIEVVTGNLHVAGAATFADAMEGKLPTVTGKLEANALDLTPLFATANDAQTIWPTSALDWSALGLFEGNLALKVGTLSIGTLQLNDADMQLALANSVLSASPVSGKFADGKATATARVEGGKEGEPGVGLTFTVEDANLAKASAQVAGSQFAAGRASLDIRAEAQGRSWLAMLSAVNGVGTIKTRDAAFAPLGVAAFHDALLAVKDVDKLSLLPNQTLAKGVTPVAGLDGDFTVKDGVVKIARDELSLDAGTAKLDAMFDLPRLAIDSELDISFNDPKDAPGFSNVASGKIGKVERRMDTAAIEQYAGKRAIARSAQDAGISYIPKELRDLIGIAGDKLKGPAVAGIPLPMLRPENKASLQ
ncbi:MAG: AsmA family protein [Parvibaculum sp.]|nr:AsmA family protein [Parvibaculum sp.]